MSIEPEHRYTRDVYFLSFMLRDPDVARQARWLGHEINIISRKGWDNIWAVRRAVNKTLKTLESPFVLGRMKRRMDIWRFLDALILLKRHCPRVQVVEVMVSCGRVA